MKIEHEFEDMEGNELGDTPPSDVTWQVMQTFVERGVTPVHIVFTHRIKPAKVQFIGDAEFGSITVVEEPDNFDPGAEGENEY